MPETVFSPEANNIMSDINKTANVNAADKTINAATKQFDAEDEALGNRILEIKKQLNELGTEEEEQRKISLSDLNNQLKIQNQIRESNAKFLSLLQKAKDESVLTGKNFNNILKQQKSQLSDQLKFNKALKDQSNELKLQNQLLEKQIKSIKDAAKEESKKVADIGKKASDATRGKLSSGFAQTQSIEGAMGLANTAMTGALTKGLTAAGSKIGGEAGSKIGGQVAGAAGGLADAIIQMMMFNLQFGMRSLQTGLILSTARGGGGGAGFSVLGGDYLASEEMAGAATMYAKAGYHADSLQKRGAGGYIGMEKMAGIEKYTADAASSQAFAEMWAPFTSGDVEKSAQNTMNIFMDIQKYVEGTGISAQKVYGWMSKLTEQAQYANVDYKFVNQTMRQMVNKSQQMASININWAKDGGKIMEGIVGMSQRMSIENIAGLAALNKSKESPFQTVASRRFGKDFGNIKFGGKGGEFGIENYNEEKSSAEGMKGTINDIKNLFYETTKGFNLDTKEGKAKALTMIPEIAQQFGVTKEEAMTMLAIKDVNSLSLKEQEKLKDMLKDPTTRTADYLGAIHTGLQNGTLSVKLEETLKSGVFGILGGILSILINLPGSIANSLKKSVPGMGGPNEVTNEYDRQYGDILKKMQTNFSKTTGVLEKVGGQSSLELIDTSKVKKHSGGISSDGIGQLGENFSPGEFRFRTKEPVRIMSVAQANSLANNSSGNGSQTFNINITSGGIVAERGVIEALKGIMTRGLT